VSEAWLNIPFRELPVASGNGINPYEFPDEEFELYSVPAHETGHPEIVLGQNIASNKQIVSEGMALLCKINPRINRTWVVKPASGRRQIASTEWIAFDLCSVLIPEYLMYYMRQADFHEFLTTNASGVGGSLMRIKPATFASYEFIVKLDDLFSDLDTGVAELKAAQKKLAQYRQSLLKAAVEGQLTAEWRTNNKPKETGAQLLERILKERRARWEVKQLAKFKEQGKTPPKGWQDKYPEPVQPDTTNLPELPEGWVWASVDQVGEVFLGKMLDKAKHQDGVKLPYLRNISVRWGNIETHDLPEMYFEEDELDRYGLVAGDLLVCEGGEPGRAAVCGKEHEELKYQKALHRVRLFRLYEPELLMYYLDHVAKTGMLEQFFTGSTIKHFTKESFLMLPIPLPSNDEQTEIVEQLKSSIQGAQEQKVAITHSLTQASAQRKNILKSAFSGQLVPQDLKDEPASALLERIRAERAARTAGKKPARRTKRKEVAHD
jgi:type I restriction enzyme S subunit